MTSDPQWRLVYEIHSVASELEGMERVRYLNEHCSDAAVRQEVERLLAAGPAEKTPAKPQKQRELEPGSRLGEYEIQGKLGAGGMGWVYQALDHRLNRPVALKILPPGKIAGDSTRLRFAWEAEAASALNHPSIVTVYEMGREGDIDFIAMERVN